MATRQRWELEEKRSSLLFAGRRSAEMEVIGNMLILNVVGNV